jgi:hypothetical protein
MDELIKENEQLRDFMNEAMTMLDDHKAKFGMFQMQRYIKLKSDVEKFNRLSAKLRSSLFAITTSD